MISICIPVYNCDVTRLLTELYEQCEASDSTYEILLIDDASEEEFQLINRNTVTSIDSHNVRYEELSQNVGRAVIRNLFAHKASFPYLLFIDNDAKICSPDFFTRYLVMRSPSVICYGGCVYEYTHENCTFLRWVYGADRETTPADIRNNNPSNYFSTFNFLIDKRILLLHPFNEQIREYGYEDLLFKIELVTHNYKITHIENPLIHTGIISNEDFVRRTEHALNNLQAIELKEIVSSSDLYTHVNILKTFNKLDKLRLIGLGSLGFRVFKKALLKNLLSDNPSLFVFDLYKLGYLCNLKVKNK